MGVGNAVAECAKTATRSWASPGREYPAGRLGPRTLRVETALPALLGRYLSE